jgi:hypothetical protein
MLFPSLDLAAAPRGIAASGQRVRFFTRLIGIQQIVVNGVRELGEVFDVAAIANICLT